MKTGFSTARRHALIAISAAVVLLYDLARVLTGTASEQDLVAVRESEEL